MQMREVNVERHSRVPMGTIYTRILLIYLQLDAVPKLTVVGHAVDRTV